LGELFFPIVAKLSPDYAPRITGMLIDLDMSKIQEIIPLLEDEELLK
jgi:hypothetical protein